MVGPLVVPDLVVEVLVVVGPAADVDDHVVVGVGVVEVAGHVLDGVPVGLLDDVGGGEGHGDDPLGDVGEVEVVPLVVGGAFGPGHHLPYKVEH